MPKPLRILLTAVVVLIAVWLQWQQGKDESSTLVGREAVVETLFRERKSDTVVEVSGQVIKTLPDDLEGSKHQKFILELPSGHTVLVSHNISLAPRVPLRGGDEVELRGEYEWSEKGGVIHWTHHDPGGRRPGGWIKHDGKDYR